MSEMTCPLCGQEMAAIETYAGRGELYCGHCDLTIGGNEAKTPDELVALLEQRTCKAVLADGWYRGINGYSENLKCSKCSEPLFSKFLFCPWCGRRVEEEAE